jgi:hypothetical protein
MAPTTIGPRRCPTWPFGVYVLPRDVGASVWPQPFTAEMIGRSELNARGTPVNAGVAAADGAHPRTHAVAKKRRRLRELARDEKRVGAPIPAYLRPRPALDYELDAKPDHPFRSTLRNLTPGLNYLTGSYQRRWLRRDGIAGVAVAAYLVPQVMAYSALIGVPPVASLWTALAAIGSSSASCKAWSSPSRFSLLEMLLRVARPHEGVLGRVPGIAGMHDVDDYPDARTIPGCMFYRYDAPLFFANIRDLRERVHKLLVLENQAYPDSPARWFVLNVEANTEIDITAADGLRELARELADSGVHLGLARVKNDLYVPLDRAGVIDAVGKDMLFATLPVAEESYLRWALAQEPAQPAETPAEVVDDEPASSLLPWHRPAPHDNRDAEPTNLPLSRPPTRPTRSHSTDQDPVDVMKGLGRPRIKAPVVQGPFPRGLPPNPAGLFRGTRLSSDLCRLRVGLPDVDGVVAGGADHEGLAPTPDHDFDRSRL